LVRESLRRVAPCYRVVNHTANSPLLHSNPLTGVTPGVNLPGFAEVGYDHVGHTELIFNAIDITFNKCQLILVQVQ
jgi:hypothetical protein